MLALASGELRAQTTWDGSAGTDWFDGANWSSGIPDAADVVTVPAGLSNYPVLDAAGAICRSLLIEPDAKVDLQTFTLTILDDFTPGAPDVIESQPTGALRFAGNNFFQPQIHASIAFGGDIVIDRQGFVSWIKIGGPIVCDDFEVVDGIARMTTEGSHHEHQILGNVTVAAGAELDRVNATLDIGGDVTIRGTWDDTDSDGGTFVAGDWTDTETFLIGSQTVTFDGGGTSIVRVPDAIDFHGLVITSGTTVIVATDIDVDNSITIDDGCVLDVDGDIDVTGGEVTMVGASRLQIGATITSLGTFTAAIGTVEYDSTTANQTIKALPYHDLEIDKDAFTATANTTIGVSGNMVVVSGVLGIPDAGDLTVSGNVAVAGTLSMSGAGVLRLGNSLVVDAGGTFSATGSPVPTVTNDGSTDYTFTVASGGAIDVSGLNFSNSEATGLTVADGATILGIRHVAFTNIDPDADATGDTFLRVLLTGSGDYSFVGLTFDATCTYNVETAAGTAIKIRMVIPGGARGTELYENEGTFGSIDWPLFTRAWVGGEIGLETNWDVPTNWFPTEVPTATDDCLIPDVDHDPILNTTGNVNSIYVGNGGQLTISADFTMNLSGDFVLHQDGVLSMTSGRLRFRGLDGQSIDDEGGDPVTVYDLTVDKSTGALSSSGDLVIGDDLIVVSGAVAVNSLTWTITDLANIDDLMMISTGRVDVGGTFDATGGTITFTGAGRLELGGGVTSLGSFTANASTVEYDRTVSNVTVADVVYNDLEIDTGNRIASAGADVTVTGDVTVASGTLAADSYTISVTGATEVHDTLTIGSGVYDADGSFDASGGDVIFTGAGRLQLGDEVMSLGTLTQGAGTVEFDDAVSNQVVPTGTYTRLEIDKGAAAATVLGALTVTSSLTIVGGILDVDGALDATGATVSLGPGRLELGGAVPSLGTLVAGTGTVRYDDTLADRTVVAVDYEHLEIDNAPRVALTGGDITASGNLTVLSGEFEVDDGDILRIDGDVTVAGTLDIEQGSVLQLSGASNLSVGGVFEAVGTSSNLARISTSDPVTPGRYSFAVGAGGRIISSYASFAFMDTGGIQVVDNPLVTALAQLDHTVFENGASGGTLLTIVDNDDAVAMPGNIFEDDGTGIAHNVATSGATATITLDPYGGDSGGVILEDDNGAGVVTPGTIVWGVYTPATLTRFEPLPVPGGVLLEFETASERDCAGFEIERLDKSAGAFVPVGVARIPATGGPAVGASYAALDDTVPPRARPTYRLVEIDRRGGRTVLAERRTSSSGLATVPLGVQRLSVIPSPTPRRAATMSRPKGAGYAAGSNATAAATGPSAPTPTTESVRILVEMAGVVRVDHATLLAAGFPVGADPRRFELRHVGEVVPLAGVGTTDGSFDPGDAFDFVAAEYDHPDTRFDVYRLELLPPGGVGARMAEWDGSPPLASGVGGTFPETIHLEQQNFYGISLVDGTGRDHWFWDLLISPQTLDVPFVAPGVIPLGPTSSVEIVLEGWTEDPLSPIDHRTRVLVNGFEVGTMLGLEAGRYAETFEVPAGVLIDGPNTITLVAVPLEGPDVVFLDAVTVRYARLRRAAGGRLAFSAPGSSVIDVLEFDAPVARLYQVSGPGAPRRVTGASVVSSTSGSGWDGRFLAPAGDAGYEWFIDAAHRAPFAVVPATRLTPVPGAFAADWIAIAPEAWSAEVERLAAHRRRQGLRSIVVPLEWVRETYDGGRATRDAIVRYLQDVLTSPSGAPPAYLLLVGDATYDPKGHLGPSPRQVIPTGLIEAGGLESATDEIYADCIAADGVPELAVGRLPVATLDECRGTVDKIIRSEAGARGPRTPAWSGASAALVVSDDEADFDGIGPAVAAALPAGLPSIELDLATSAPAQFAAELAGAWESAPLVHYTGHGSRLAWADEAILHVDDVATLPADATPPIVIAMNCLNGFFQLPGGPSLGEALVVAPDRGAIAYWGPTSVTSHRLQGELAAEFYRHWGAPRGGRTPRLGDAIRSAKTALADDAEFIDVLETWVLLGDPATPLP